MKRIVLLRHGQSQWNLENRFTGWTDVDLTEQGLEEARKAGELLKKEGFKVFLCTAVSYLHQDSGSTGKSIKSLVKREKIRQTSERLYYSKYLSIGGGQKLLVYIFQTIVLLETLLYEAYSAKKKQSR